RMGNQEIQDGSYARRIGAALLAAAAPISLRAARSSVRDLTNRVLSPWLFGVVDDTARAALMLALAGAAISLQERSGSRRQASADTGQVAESLLRAAPQTGRHHRRQGARRLR